MDGFRYSTKLRVRYSEIDGLKIVFNAHYLTYLDIAIGNYFNEGIGLNMLQLAEDGEFDFVLAKSTVEYIESARFGDTLEIWVRTVKLGNTSFTVDFVITRENEKDPLIKAEIIYVSYDPETNTSRPVPDFIREKIIQYDQL